MDDKQRLQLQNMIKANNVEDQTELIRNLKHSQVLRNEVNNMILVKAKHRGDDEKIYNECVNECNFLFTYYTDIFNKIRKDEIEIGILNKFLDVLRKIEDGELNLFAPWQRNTTIIIWDFGEFPLFPPLFCGFDFLFIGGNKIPKNESFFVERLTSKKK